MNIVYKTYGVDSASAFETRQNIRYMRMFGNAFMYASGDHVGIEFGSVAALMKGEPTDLIGDAKENKLFGWGIAHEIGHVMDALGKAEVTNNIYSLMLQTYDGENNILPSRLETSNIYPKAFEKVSSGTEGVPNNVFVHLAMYWQLHLAYDGAGEDSLNFYNQLHKLYRDGSLNSFSDMDKFAVAASKVAEKNLTEFFTRWGVKLSESAKTEMAKLPEETRAIYYLNDESRRQRLAGNQGNTNISITATAAVNTVKPKEVNITIEGDNDNVQGYEIIRNGKTIAFTTEKSFTDTINSANNLTFTYKVLPVDILGNKGREVDAGQVRISYDKTIDSNLYTVNGDTVTFKESTIVTGIKITPKAGQTLPTSGEFSVSVAGTVTGENGEEAYTAVAKAGNFSNPSDSKDTNSYVAYFGKEGLTADKLWSYDVTSIQLTGIDTSKYNVEFISYPGDNIEFLEMGVGRLKADYDLGEGQSIKAGTLVIVGNYRGNTSTKKIRINGKFETGDVVQGTTDLQERAINGEIYMFDEIGADGKITSSTKDGLFIFVPDLQKESDHFGDHGHEEHSVLPAEIQAQIHEGSEEEDNLHITSNTLWVNMPSEDSLPEIVLTTGSDEGGLPEVALATE